VKSSSDKRTAIARSLMERGVSLGELLGSGMEGSVFDAGGEQVVKIWDERTIAELRVLQAFYASADRSSLTFELPAILDVFEVENHAISVERRLPGHSLKSDVDPDAPEIRPHVFQAVQSILEGLRGVPGTQAMRAIPVLSGYPLYSSDAQSWSQALSGLALERSDQYAHLLRRDIPDFDERRSAILNAIVQLDQSLSSALIHGDICPENILVDNNGRVVALVDFGFLSSAGDPMFDASIAACITEMYGPHHADHELQMSRAISEVYPKLGQVKPFYQAAYGLITSNAYDEEGLDGHYAFCVDLIRSRDLDTLL
jgi:serine/threonine protein kinase